jgi:nucleoside-diphosphate-sugar epimerase
MTKVLLTGAAGYQASYIIRRLRAKYDLTLFDRAAPREEFSDLPFISGDITRLEDVERAMENCDAVVHWWPSCAGATPCPSKPIAM